MTERGFWSLTFNPWPWLNAWAMVAFQPFAMIGGMTAIKAIGVAAIGYLVSDAIVRGLLKPPRPSKTRLAFYWLALFLIYPIAAAIIAIPVQ